MTPTLFGNRRFFFILCLSVLVVAGIGLRFINITNPPLDLHAWRQLRAAAITRSMYYTMLPDADPDVVAQARYLGATYTHMEPRIFEQLVAWIYLLTGEQLWLARLYSILFYVVGGIGLFILARWIAGIDGAMVSLAYYLFLPFGVTHSRIFLPDLLMLPFIIFGLVAIYRWIEIRSWKWVLLAGGLSGFAILVKAFAVYYLIIPTFLLLLTSSGKLKQTFRSPQTWVLLGLMILIPGSYYFSGVTRGAGNYISTWSLPYLNLLLDPNFYIGWFHKLGEFNLTLLVISLLSLPLLPKQGRVLAAGLWLGYVALGLTLPSLIRSHAYYSLPLVFIVALSLSGSAKLFLSKVAEQKLFWQIIFLAGVLIGLGDSMIMARKPLTAEDYRQEPAFWQALGKRLPTDGNIIGLSEDYNTRIQYYGWRYVKQYPFRDDFDMSILAGGNFNPEDDNWGFFKGQVEGMDYFLVTTLDEFDNQPYLRRILYENYSIVMQDERFVLFDLRKPLQVIPE